MPLSRLGSSGRHEALEERQEEPRGRAERAGITKITKFTKFGSRAGPSKRSDRVRTPRPAAKIRKFRKFRRPPRFRRPPPCRETPPGRPRPTASPISDPNFVLSYRSLASLATIPCPDSADSDDSARLDLSDGVYVLAQLYLGGSPPLDPSPACGADPTADGLGCASFGPCAEAHGLLVTPEASGTLRISDGRLVLEDSQGAVARPDSLPTSWKYPLSRTPAMRSPTWMTTRSTCRSKTRSEARPEHVRPSTGLRPWALSLRYRFQRYRHHHRLRDGPREGKTVTLRARRGLSSWWMPAKSTLGDSDASIMVTFLDALPFEVLS
jgi:hypothetical protein